MSEDLALEIEKIKKENELLINTYNSHAKEIETHQKTMNELQVAIVENNGAIKRILAIVSKREPTKEE